MWRVTEILVREFHQLLPEAVEELLRMSLGVLDGNGSNWERALVLEIYGSLLADPRLVSHLCGLQWAEQHCINDMVVTVNNLILGLAVALQNQELSFARAAVKIPLLQQFDKLSAPPEVFEQHLLLAAFTCIARFIQTQQESLTRGPQEDHDGLIETLWAALLKTFSALLGGCKLNVDWLDPLLNSAQRLCRLEAALGLSDALRSTLAMLAEIALPEYHPSSPKGLDKPTAARGSLLVSEVNLAASVAILELGLELGEFLDDAWLSVVQIIHGHDQFSVLTARRTDGTLGQHGNQSGTSITLGHGRKETSPVPDMARLGEIAELSRQTVEASMKLSPQAFAHFVGAIDKLSEATLHIPGPNAAAVRGMIALFPVQKLKQVTLLNLHRFLETPSDEETTRTWGMVVGRLDKALGSPDPILRGLGCETVALMYTQFTGTIDTARFAASELLQMRIMEALDEWMAVAGESWVDVQKTVHEALHRTLQGLGPHISWAWPVVFRTLCRTVERPAPAKEAPLAIVKIAFSSTSLICGDLLSSLGLANIDRVVEVVWGFASHVRADLNISLTAVGVLWDVADHVRRSGSLSQWLHIQERLVPLTVDDRPEVRHSAIQTAMRAIEIGGGALEAAEWTILLEQIVDVLLETIPRHADPSRVTANAQASSGSLEDGDSLVHHTRATDTLQWDETQLLLLNGITQLYCKFLPRLITVPNFVSRHWNTLLERFLAYCGPRGFSLTSVELVTAAIGNLLRLVECAVDEPRLWVACWTCWRDMSMAMDQAQMIAADAVREREAELIPFTQDSLIRHARIFPRLFHLHNRPTDANWLVASVEALERALRCPTPADPVRDAETLTELQRTVLELVDSVMDFDGSHRESRSLHLSWMAGWLQWIQPVPVDTESPETIVANGTRGIVHPVSPLPPATSESAPIIKGAYSFIAFTAAVLERLKRRVVGWREDPRIYSSGAVAKGIDAVGRLAVLKYQIPSSATRRPTWQVAAEGLNSILVAILSAAPGVNDLVLWGRCLRLCEDYLETSRTMVPTHLPLDQLEHDEDFDVAQVGWLHRVLLPLLAQHHLPDGEGEETDLVDAEIINDYGTLDGSAEALALGLITALAEKSKLYTSHHDLPKVSFPVAYGLFGTGFSDVVPVIKEKFALACLEVLFQLCDTALPAPTSPGLLRSGSSRGGLVSSSSDPQLALSAQHHHPPVQVTTSLQRIALPVLLARCRRVLDTYLADRPLLGRIPLPRLRHAELHLILGRLNELRIPPGSMSGNLLGGECGHLFSLYALYCEMVTVGEGEVLGSVQEAWRLMGRQLGLL